MLAHVRAPSRGVYLAEQAWRPRPCVTRTGGPGRPGFPSALKTKGCLRKKAGTVRMKGGESRPDHGDESLRFGPDEPVPGWKTPQWSAGRRRARKARGRLLRGARPRRSANRRSAPSHEGKGKEKAQAPRRTTSGADESRLFECACSHAG